MARNKNVPSQMQSVGGFFNNSPGTPNLTWQRNYCWNEVWATSGGNFCPNWKFRELKWMKMLQRRKKIVCRRLKINRNFPYPSKLANFMLARIARKLIKICQKNLANLLHDYFKINELIYRQVMQYCDSVAKLFVEFLDPSLSRKHDKLVSKGC